VVHIQCTVNAPQKVNVYGFNEFSVNNDHAIPALFIYQIYLMKNISVDDIVQCVRILIPILETSRVHNIKIRTINDHFKI